MPVNGFLKIPSDMSHPLPRALENVFHRYGGAPSRTMLLGESCGEPSSSPCYVTSSTFPGTELGLLKCFVEMQASAAVSAPPHPHWLPKGHDSVPKEVASGVWVTQDLPCPRWGRGGKPKVRNKQCSWALNRKTIILKTPFSTLAPKGKQQAVSRAGCVWETDIQATLDHCWVSGVERTLGALLHPLLLLQILQWAESTDPWPSWSYKDGVTTSSNSYTLLEDPGRHEKLYSLIVGFQT